MANISVEKVKITVSLGLALSFCAAIITGTVAGTLWYNSLIDGQVQTRTAIDNLTATVNTKMAEYKTTDSLNTVHLYDSINGLAYRVTKLEIKKVLYENR